MRKLNSGVVQMIITNTRKQNTETLGDVLSSPSGQKTEGTQYHAHKGRSIAYFGRLLALAKPTLHNLKLALFAL